MGYFSNSTDGECYEAKYCNRCAHEDDEKGCPIMLAHLLYAYELCNEEKHPGKVMLDLLIPRAGPHNGQCAMFVPVTSLRSGLRRPTDRAKAAKLEARLDELRKGRE